MWHGQDGAAYPTIGSVVSAWPVPWTVRFGRAGAGVTHKEVIVRFAQRFTAILVALMLMILSSPTAQAAVGPNSPPPPPVPGDVRAIIGIFYESACSPAVPFPCWHVTSSGRLTGWLETDLLMRITIVNETRVKGH